jgi:hypothetical protein
MTNGDRGNGTKQEGREKEDHPSQSGEAGANRYRHPPQQARNLLQGGQGSWPVSGSGAAADPLGLLAALGHTLAEPTHIETKGKGSRPVTAMMKAAWNDLLARFPEPYLLVAVLPGSSERESIDNAQSAQRLLVRLIRNLPTHGEFAVMVSRQSGQREILCAFGDGSDAALVAKAAGASMSDRVRYSFMLDSSAERKLLKIAGPPEPHRPRATAYDRWQS